MVSGLGASAAAKISGGLGKGLSFAAKNSHNLMAAGNFVGDTSRYMNQGTSVSGSVVRAGVQNVMWATNPGVMGAAMASQVAVQGVQAAHQYRRVRAEDFRSIENQSQRIGQGFMDTNQAQTMRQAALQQIQGNKLNARSALGGEARIFSNRRYTG